MVAKSGKTPFSLKNVCLIRTLNMSSTLLTCSEGNTLLLTRGMRGAQVFSERALELKFHAW